MTLSAVALALGEIEKSPDGVSGNDSSGDPLVDASIHFIRTNCHRAVGVDDIAKHAGISRRMLERRFARTWLRSVAQELTLARVRRGRDLLSEKSLTVKEAGYAAGFGSARHFISAHRRIFGTTPGFARHQS
ncbi:MAG: helix-turn-helix domain-containing protein [Terrimicrobiaceae bacterium]